MSRHSLDLVEDADDQSVSTTLPKHLAPYVREYYEARKRVGETLEQFVSRNVAEAAVNWKAGLLTAQTAKENADATTVDSGDLAEQASTLLAR